MGTWLGCRLDSPPGRITRDVLRVATGDAPALTQGVIPEHWPSEGDAACPASYHFCVRKISALRLAVVVLLVGVGAVALVWVTTHREPGLRPYNGHRPPGHYSPRVYSPDWTTPLVGLMGIMALGAAVLVFRRRH